MISTPLIEPQGPLTGHMNVYPYALDSNRLAPRAFADKRVLFKESGRDLTLGVYRSEGYPLVGLFKNEVIAVGVRQLHRIAELHIVCSPERRFRMTLLATPSSRASSRTDLLSFAMSARTSSDKKLGLFFHR